MGNPLIAGAMPVDGPPPGTYRIVWPRVGVPLNLTLLSERITGVVTHWLTKDEAPPKGRTILCLRDECECCRSGKRMRWLGYQAAWDHDSRKVRVAVCSRDAVGLLARTIGYGTTPRGQRVIMARAGKDDSGPVFWSSSHDHPLTPLLPTPDILPTLTYIYGEELPAVLAQWAAEQEGM